MSARQALAAIAARAGAGDLAFPTHARVTLRVQRALEDPEMHVETAARLIQAEPLLAARVVAVANSLAYNPSGRTVADVRTAVARLGFHTVRSLAMAVLTRQLQGTAVPAKYRELAAQLWTHTAHVSALARMLAHRVTQLDPEIAMFAGILHEIGGFYLLSHAHEFPDLLDSEPFDWEGGAEADLGRAVLRALQVPEQVTGAIEAYWEGFLAMPPATLGDTLLLADRLAPVESPFRQFETSNTAQIPASIEMIIGAETLTAILSDSAAEVDSLVQALRM